MKRREFLKAAALTAAASVNAVQAFAQEKDTAADAGVRRVLIVFLCHLDVGFTDTQAKVLQKYFDQYFPQAMATAAHLRQQHSPDRYRWTTGSWLLYEYLEQANSTQRKQIEASIVAGDLTWHAMPFNWQTEVLDRSMAEGCMGFSASLDRRFGRKTTGGKMTDVPGHSRGLVSVLAGHGVQLLDIGVNGASTPPQVPEVFAWQATDGSRIAMLYHRRSYGGQIRVPGSDLVVDVEVRGDNSGPHSLAEIHAIYAALRAKYPNAKVQAADLSAVAGAVQPLIATLPVVTQEIGDTWIYGVPSDPVKMARYREVARLRQEWIQGRRLATGDAVDLQMLRRLSLAAEHTWGTDTKRYIDHQHYPPKQLAQYLNTPGYRVMEQSWQEKRDDIDAGVASLPQDLRAEAMGRLDALRVVRPPTSGLRRAPADGSLRTQWFDLQIDRATGSIHQLIDRRTGIAWASPLHPLALFSYQTLTQADYSAFLDAYVLSKASWAPQDFGKPNIGQFPAQSKSWSSVVRNLWVQQNSGEDRLLAELAIEDTAAGNLGLTAWPSAIYMELRFPRNEAAIDITVSTFGKVANRMPEAMWLSFVPEHSSDAEWVLDKVGEPVPADDVVPGGGRRMHAVSSKVSYRHQGRRLEFVTMDAPVVAMGTKSPLNYSRQLPAMEGGIHFCLFNNAWGTNYIQWAGGDWKYRFRLSIPA